MVAPTMGLDVIQGVKMGHNIVAYSLVLPLVTCDV